MDELSAELLERYTAGDDDAAAVIFERYVQRLTLLARSRLSSRLAGRLDPEDVVQSAFRSFFVGAQQGQFSLKRNGDLWRLLVAITLRKVYRNANRHTADKRSVNREERSVGWYEAAGIDLSSPVDPAHAMALADELECVLAKLGTFERRVLELRLQGTQLADIASDTARSERSVRRALATIRQVLANRLNADAE